LQEPDADVHQHLARADLDGVPIAEPERALLRFAEIVTRRAYRTTDADVEALRDHGWTDPQIAEAVYIIALFAFFNRVADAFGLEKSGYFDNPPPRGGNPAPPPEVTPG